MSTSVVAAALREELGASPGIFGPVASHPSTEPALVSAYWELRDLCADALGAPEPEGGGRGAPVAGGEGPARTGPSASS